MCIGEQPQPLFEDRHEAGRRLAEALDGLAGRNDVIVLALPRGGVPVAAEVAKQLQARLDVFLVRKLGVPGHRELAMGAIASGNVRVMNRDVIQSLHISSEAVEATVEAERQELERRERLYRPDNDELALRGRTVVLVDDGLATGATMRAAIEGVRTRDPGEVIVAVPVAAAEVCSQLTPLVDQMICLAKPANFGGVGAWYRHFGQTSDAEVRSLLDEVHATAN
ncbi:MAG: phosphoribosyltransferase [Caldilineaceae bacterium]